MSRRKPTLEEFLAMEHVPNLYIWFKSIECYMRKGKVFVDGRICTALTIANITNHKRRENGFYNPAHKRTGLFKRFETYVREMSKKHGYEGVYVELVFNEFLPDVLMRYGYQRVNIRGIEGYQEQNYWFEHERSG